jgi:hypothetical protein
MRVFFKRDICGSPHATAGCRPGAPGVYDLLVCLCMHVFFKRDICAMLAFVFKARYLCYACMCLLSVIYVQAHKSGCSLGASAVCMCVYVCM